MGRLSGWTLFTLRGVPLSIHVSLLFLLLYVFLVATSQFHLIVKQSGVDAAQVSGSPISWSIVFAISLIVSVFLHEFSHVLVAQAQGAKVRRITLMMLGGVSEMEKLPEKPASEFKIAIIGPLVSLALGGILLALHNTTKSADLALFGYWIGQLNIVLGVFNLIPAFPTDGGRVLRSILVARQGRLRGTQNAVNVSRVFAIAFGILGFVQFNILLILIALFIYAGAKAELFVVMGQTILKGLRVRDIMMPLSGVPESATLVDAAQAMAQAKSTVLPVLTKGPPYGIINSTILGSIPRNLWPQVHVNNVKAEVLKAPHPDEPLENVLSESLTHGLNGLPVIENETLVGVMRLSDLLETIQLRELVRDEQTGSFQASANPSWKFKTQR